MTFRDKFSINKILWALMIVLCGFLIYKTIDANITLDYVNQDKNYQEQQMHLMQLLLQQTGKKLGRTEITAIVKKDFSADHIVKEEDNRLEVDSVVFIFDGETLTEVKSLDEL